MAPAVPMRVTGAAVPWNTGRCKVVGANSCNPPRGRFCLTQTETTENFILVWFGVRTILVI